MWVTKGLNDDGLLKTIDDFDGTQDCEVDSRTAKVKQPLQGHQVIRLFAHVTARRGRRRDHPEGCRGICKEEESGRQGHLPDGRRRFREDLFEADLIDDGFNIHPVLQVRAFRFYEMKNQIDLELLTCQPFKNGCVAVTYRVKH